MCGIALRTTSEQNDPIACASELYRSETWSVNGISGCKVPRFWPATLFFFVYYEMGSGLFNLTSVWHSRAPEKGCCSTHNQQISCLHLIPIPFTRGSFLHARSSLHSYFFSTYPLISTYPAHLYTYLLQFSESYSYKYQKRKKGYESCESYGSYASYRIASYVSFAYVPRYTNSSTLDLCITIVTQQIISFEVRLEDSIAP